LIDGIDLIPIELKISVTDTSIEKRSSALSNCPMTKAFDNLTPWEYPKKTGIKRRITSCRYFIELS
jgi:hypothetical protein